MREDCLRFLQKNEDAGQQVSDFVNDLPTWYLSALIHPDESTRTSEEHVYTDKETGTSIRFVSDIILEFSYLVVHGSSQEVVAKQLAASVPLLSTNDLFALWDNAKTCEEKVEAILRLAVASPPANLERSAYASRLTSALNDGNAEVRDACLLAMSYRKWHELRSEVVLIENLETDELTKKRATLLLARWDED